MWERVLRLINKFLFFFQQFAIVTQYVSGGSLYSLLHEQNRSVFLCLLYCLGDVVVDRAPALGAGGLGFYPQTGHTKDFKNGSNGCPL